jgi:hypothetical protein
MAGILVLPAMMVLQRAAMQVTCGQWTEFASQVLLHPFIGATVTVRQADQLRSFLKDCG